jgi:hypothetical protein
MCIERNCQVLFRLGCRAEVAETSANAAAKATCPAKSYYTFPIHDSGFSSFRLNALGRWLSPRNCAGSRLVVILLCDPTESRPKLQRTGFSRSETTSVRTIGKRVAAALRVQWLIPWIRPLALPLSVSRLILKFGIPPTFLYWRLVWCFACGRGIGGSNHCN